MNVELLDKVKAHILEEPTRLLMDTFERHATSATPIRVSSTRILRPSGMVVWGVAPFREQPVPPCGTAACIGGWAGLLSGEKQSEREGQQGFMRRVLDIDELQAFELFYPDHWPADLAQSYGEAETAEGRAIVAAAVIDRFKAKYAPVAA